MPGTVPELNPYLSPQAPGQGAPQYSPVGYSVEVLSRSWLLWKLAVSGPCPCIVEYNGRGLGYETVLVNGVVASRASGGFFHLAPRLEFAVPGTFGPQRAWLDVQTSRLQLLGGLRLWIGNRVVYSEGTW
jgi:hypothetical protein